MKKRTYYIAFFILLGISTFSRAQDCTQRLEQAQQAFEDGQIELIPNLVGDCIEKNFTRIQMGQAYKLLVLTHIYDNEPQLAEETMLELLRHDPLFEVDLQNDPAEFIHLYNQFRTDPILKVGVNFGGNTQFYNVAKTYGPENQNEISASYAGIAGLVFGIGAEYPINKRWAATADLNYTIRKTKIEKEPLFAFNTLELEETQGWVDLSLMGKYFFKDLSKVSKPDGMIIPFAKLGVTMNLMLSDDGRLTTTQQDLKDIKGPTEDLSEFKNTFQFGAMAGVGGEYHFGKSIIMVTANFQFIFDDLVDSDSRGTQDAIRILNKYGYQEDDYKAHTISLIASYRQKIFNPKKLTK